MTFGGGSDSHLVEARGRTSLVQCTSVSGIGHPAAGLPRLGTALLLGLVLALSAGLPASAHDIRVRHSLFGMHDDTETVASLESLHEGWVRIWYGSARWDHIETSPGIYDWTHLDALVAQAAAHHARITLVLAMTPSFYSGTPTNIPGRRIDRYRAFARRLMTRYGDRVESYQVWNEANIATYWTGSPGKMARLTKVLHDVRDNLDPTARVVAPSMVTRLHYELAGMSRYFGRRVEGKPVWRYVDAAAFSLYPLARYHGRHGVPEDTLPLLRAVRQRLHAAGVPDSMPIWDTEVNFGLRSGTQALTAAEPISAARQAANVARTYLLQASRGVRRIAWYRYDWPELPTGGTIGNTLLTDPTDVTRLTAAGRAYALVRTWMHGRLRGHHGRPPCLRDGHGTYDCVVTDAGGTRHIYWNPFHRARVRLPAYVGHRQGVLGATGSVSGGSRVSVDFRPVMYSR